jgi:hypothetical protein
MRGARTALLVTAGLLCVAGCKSVSSEQIETLLEPGLSKADTLALLGENVNLQVVRVINLPKSGDLDEIEDPALRGIVLSAMVRTDAPIAQFVEVKRPRFVRSDDFYLFFDDRDQLVHWQRSRTR